MVTDSPDGHVLPQERIPHEMRASQAALDQVV